MALIQAALTALINLPNRHVQALPGNLRELTSGRRFAYYSTRADAVAVVMARELAEVVVPEVGVVVVHQGARPDLLGGYRGLQGGLGDWRLPIRPVTARY